MAESTQSVTAALPEQKSLTKDSVVSTSVIGAHTLEHYYANSFPVLVAAMYTDLGLVPIQAGILSAVRMLAGGVTGTLGGFFVDIFRHRTAQVLAVSMALIALGYFLVSISPTYGFILVALSIASAGSALWHPPALGLLARRFPRRRGLFISLHRSMGNVGDWIGPIIAGALLSGVFFLGIRVAPLSWRMILGGGTPILLLLAVVLLIILRNLGEARTDSQPVANRFKLQLGGLRESFRGAGMWSIFSVSAIRGMADRGIVWLLPLYLADELDKSFAWIGVHQALLVAPGVVAGPIFGILSDYIGRKSLTIFFMAISVLLTLGMIFGNGGIMLTLSVALFGVFHYSVSSLTQAAAIDHAEGRGLEATFLGLMWGSNTLFGAGSLIAIFWVVGVWGWAPAFYATAGLFFVGFLVALLMPAGRPRARRAYAR
ncbi:MAG: MFS transporter [Dehalococcoidia bacterium]